MGDSSSPAEAMMLLGLLGGFLLVVAAIGLVVNLILSYFLWSAYRVVPAKHQRLPVGLVWLCAVPCLGWIMLIVVSVMVPQAFQAAFAERGRTGLGDCGMVLALVGSVGMVAGPAVPVLGPAISLACLVVFIVFVVKLHGCKRALLVA